ncbi:hypothetical protein LG943_11980 [Streptomonospora sp. S1-112]|uniref:Integral membrane protein n=1 Tax=Streptomonospora mangrovi TaxID=2883123 RepID=A0A9X3SDN4_9ACTN|nr:hypothetical protein [Streptomonospora mangrovi]MDA0565033.1 hypothetical protein [Streptomonospora mangrovi]
MQLRAVELRVHGVSGGEAEELLDVEPAVRVSGDRLAGFFRWRRKPDTETVPDVPREIFTWGTLTSGRSSRALWLLLLPFMLVNIAYWMRPGRFDDPRSQLGAAADAVFGSAVRLLALSLTALLILAAAGIGMDLIGWQCAGHGAACAELRPLLGPLSAPGAAMAEPARALAVGALLPLLVVAVLWRLSRRTAAYTVTGALPDPDPAGEAPLSTPGFWRREPTTARLRSAHIATAVAVVTALLLAPPLTADGLSGPGPLGAALAVLTAAVVLLSAAGVVLPDDTPRRHRLADLVCRVARDLSLGLLVAALAYALWPRPGWSAHGALPWYSTILNTLFAVQCVLGAVLLAAAIVLHLRRGTRASTPLSGTAGPAAAILGTLLGGALSAATVYQAAGWLGGCYYPGAEDDGCISLQPAGAYSWLQLAFTMEGAIALACAAALLVVLRRRAPEEERTVRVMYPGADDPARTREIARARAFGDVTELLPACVAALLVPVGLLVALVLYSAITGHLTAVPEGGGTRTTGGPESVTAGALQSAVTVMVTVGSFLGGAFLLALMWLGGTAYRNQPTRQAVGVLWDVGTFWPRLAHPLAPPSYGERAVPQLAARVAHMAEEGTGVVLSGHSQGSVLAAATLWQLPRRLGGRIVLLTHGSPLSRLYARYFPAYFGPASLGDLGSRALCWRNLWRATDPIGGPVCVAREGGPHPVEFAEPLPDPRDYGVRPGEALCPEVLGHSLYTSDPVYAMVMAEAVELLAERAHPRAQEDAGALAAPTARPGAARAAVEGGAGGRAQGADPGPPAEGVAAQAHPVLPGAVGPVLAADTAHGRADVEQVDQRDDQRDEDEEPY